MNIDHKKTIKRIKAYDKNKAGTAGYGNRMHMSQANYSKIEKNEVELTLSKLNT